MNVPLTISTSTRLYAVLGHPVAHSLSPAFQNSGLCAMGVDGVYLAFDIAPGTVRNTLEALSRLNAGGVNVTLPHKREAFEHLSDLAESALSAGSVNTIEFLPDGGMRGHSTDGVGVRSALEESFGHGFSGRRVLILGCGGAGRAAALQAAREGAAAVRLANRTRSRAEALEGEIREKAPACEVSTAASWPPSPEEVLETDLVIQSTSLGMNEGEETGLTPDHFREEQALLDMTYVRRVTPTMALAEQAGARTANGLGMLLHQGVASLRIWTGKEPPVEVMRNALERAAGWEANDGN